MSNPKFVYEVNLFVQRTHAQEFSAWLTPHIEEMLTFPGFLRADWYTRRTVDEKNSDDVVLWTIHYHLRDRKDFESYLECHAQRMRADGLQRFAGVFSATRRLLDVHQKFLGYNM